MPQAEEPSLDRRQAMVLTCVGRLQDQGLVARYGPAAVHVIQDKAQLIDGERVLFDYGVPAFVVEAIVSAKAQLAGLAPEPWWGRHIPVLAREQTAIGRLASKGLLESQRGKRIRDDPDAVYRFDDLLLRMYRGRQDKQAVSVRRMYRASAGTHVKQPLAYPDDRVPDPSGPTDFACVYDAEGRLTCEESQPADPICRLLALTSEGKRAFLSLESNGKEARQEDGHVSVDSDKLTTRERHTLEFLWEHGAFDQDHRRTTEEISRRRNGTGQSNFKSPVSNLTKRGLVETANGRGGGVWLTPKGRFLASRLPDPPKNQP